MVRFLRTAVSPRSRVAERVQTVLSRRIAAAAEGKAGIDQASEVPASVRSDRPPKDRLRDEMYWRKATARMATDAIIQTTDQNTAGMPVALAMFKASVGTFAVNGVEKRTPFSNPAKRSARIARPKGSPGKLPLARRQIARPQRDRQTRALRQ